MPDKTKPMSMRFLAKHEEFFNGEILKSKKYLRDLSKGNKKGWYYSRFNW
jgi:hypothetical protein